MQDYVPSFFLVQGGEVFLKLSSAILSTHFQITHFDETTLSADTADG